MLLFIIIVIQFSQDCLYFLNYIEQQKKDNRNGNDNDNSDDNSAVQMLRDGDNLYQIVEKIIQSPGNRLIYLDQNNQIKGIITITDIFDYILEDSNTANNK